MAPGANSFLTFLFIHAPRHVRVRPLGIANDDGANGGMEGAVSYYVMKDKF